MVSRKKQKQALSTIAKMTRLLLDRQMLRTRVKAQLTVTMKLLASGRYDVTLKTQDIDLDSGHWDFSIGGKDAERFSTDLQKKSSECEMFNNELRNNYIAFDFEELLAEVDPQ